MYKISNGLSTPHMKAIFPITRNSYIPRKKFPFSRPRINAVYHRTEIISNLGAKMWYLVPSNLKEICDLVKCENAFCVKLWFSRKYNLKEAAP